MSPSDVTRQTLLDAAASEILERGYAAASLSRIASRLGLTKGVLAYHFPTKESIVSTLSDALASALHQAEEHARRAFPDGGLRALVAFVMTTGVATARDPAVAAAGTLTSDRASPTDHLPELVEQTSVRLEQFIAEAHVLGELESGVTTKDAARFLLITRQGIERLRANLSATESHEAAKFVSMALRGIGAREPDDVIADVVAAAAEGAIPNAF